VIDYTKNISESILNPGSVSTDFRSTIPESVKLADRIRNMKRNRSVRMHTYRGTTAGF
jgi:hypothetical protein